MPHRSPQGGWEVYRAEFPACERTTYLNTCSLGALSRRSRAAVQTFLDLWEEHGASAWYATWLGEVAALRADFERLVNAPAGSVAIPATGSGTPVMTGSGSGSVASGSRRIRIAAIATAEPK